MKTPGTAGVFFTTKVLSRALVFLGVLNLLGKNLPAPEIDAVCQGHKEFVSFSWGFLSHWQAEVYLIWGHNGSILSIWF